MKTFLKALAFMVGSLFVWSAHPAFDQAHSNNLHAVKEVTLRNRQVNSNLLVSYLQK